MEPSINIVPRWRRRKEKEKGEDDPWIPSVGGACFCEVCTQLQSRKPKSRRRLSMNRQQTRLSLSLSLCLCLLHTQKLFSLESKEQQHSAGQLPGFHHTNGINAWLNTRKLLLCSSPSQLEHRERYDLECN